jgi:hypothetical protein
MTPVVKRGAGQRRHRALAIYSKAICSSLPRVSLETEREARCHPLPPFLNFCHYHNSYNVKRRLSFPKRRSTYNQKLYDPVVPTLPHAWQATGEFEREEGL